MPNKLDIVSLKNRTQFEAVLSSSNKFYTRFAIFIVSSSELPLVRYGLIVSKKNGNAVKRNLIKRRFRELTRAYLDMTLSGIDLVIIAKSSIKGKTFHEIKEDFLYFISKMSHKIAHN